MAPSDREPPVEVATADTLVVGGRGDGVAVFRGIPFAAPAVGALRFAAPRPPDPRPVTDARRYGPISLQDLDPLPRVLPGTEHHFYHPGARADEDCLSLNVWTPDVAGSAPVLVWIHGGAFLCGSGTGAWCDGSSHARENGLVVVTVNYRLGLLGGLYLGDDDPTSANLGLQDQIAALGWVRRHIAAFGGDPSNVTVAGQSAGAISVACLLAAPAARGLFRRAIVLSGHLSACVTLDEARATTARVLDELAVDPAGDVRAQLRALSTFRLLAVQRELGVAARVFPTVTDGRTLAADPLSALEDGHASGVDLLVGATSEEARLFAITGWSTHGESLAAALRRLLPDPAAADRADRVYRELPGSEQDRLHLLATDRDWASPARALADAHAAAGNRVYHYEFAWRSRAADGRVGAAHLVDLPFALQNLRAPGVGDLLGQEALDEPATADLARRFGATIAQFARSGSVDSSPLGPWPRYTAGERRTLVVAATPHVERDRNAARLDLWVGAGNPPAAPTHVEG